MGVVPVVLLANVFLGIYYNVFKLVPADRQDPVWYVFCFDRSRLTILFNILLVPRFGAMGTAWSMLICYFGMTAITYWWGQKYYPVPFELTKILMAILGGILIYY